MPVTEKRELKAPRNISGLIEHLINKIKHPISGRANPRSSKSDPMSV